MRSDVQDCAFYTKRHEIDKNCDKNIDALACLVVRFNVLELERWVGLGYVEKK